MAETVEVFLDGETSVIVTVSPEETAIAPGIVTNLVEATAVIGPQGAKGDKGDKGEEASAYVGILPPPPPNYAGDFWVEPVDTSFYNDAPAEIFISPTRPSFTSPGLWIQTGLGVDGSGFTFWIEDGV